MAITVTTTIKGRRVTMNLGESYNGPRYGQLVITGLSEGPNTIPHGLAFTPALLNLRPSALGLWGEVAPPDQNSIFINVLPGGALDGRIDVEE